jgi:hypothetical protein
MESAVIGELGLPQIPSCLTTQIQGSKTYVVLRYVLRLRLFVLAAQWRATSAHGTSTHRNTPIRATSPPAHLQTFHDTSFSAENEGRGMGFKKSLPTTVELNRILPFVDSKLNYASTKRPKTTAVPRLVLQNELMEIGAQTAREIRTGNQSQRQSRKLCETVRMREKKKRTQGRAPQDRSPRRNDAFLEEERRRYPNILRLRHQQPDQPNKLLKQGEASLLRRAIVHKQPAQTQDATALLQLHEALEAKDASDAIAREQKVEIAAVRAELGRTQSMVSNLRQQGKQHQAEMTALQQELRGYKQLCALTPKRVTVGTQVERNAPSAPSHRSVETSTHPRILRAQSTQTLTRGSKSMQHEAGLTPRYVGPSTKEVALQREVDKWRQAYDRLQQQGKQDCTHPNGHCNSHSTSTSSGSGSSSEELWKYKKLVNALQNEMATLMKEFAHQKLTARTQDELVQENRRLRVDLIATQESLAKANGSVNEYKQKYTHAWMIHGQMKQEMENRVEAQERSIHTIRESFRKQLSESQDILHRLRKDYSVLQVTVMDKERRIAQLQGEMGKWLQLG